MFNFNRIFAVLFLALGLFGFLISITTFAQTPTPAPTTPVQTGLSKPVDTNVRDFLQPSNIRCIFQVGGCEHSLYDDLLSFLRYIAPLIATGVLIFAGYEYFADSAIKKTNAITTATSAVIGLVLVILAPAISTLIQATFTSGNQPGGKYIDPVALTNFLKQFLDFAVQLSTIVAVAVIMLGGYWYLFEGAQNENAKGKGLNAIKVGVIGLLTIILANPIVSLVQSTFGFDPNAKIYNKDEITLKADPTVAFVKAVLGNFLIPLSSIVAVLFIVIAGYYYMTANGDEGKIKTGKNMLTNAIIGIIIILFATTVVQLTVLFVKPSEVNLPSNVPVGVKS